jgi:hypothetical protein
MIYKNFEIVVRVYAYTECTLTDDGRIHVVIDTNTDFDDVIEYQADDGNGNSFWDESLDGIKAHIDKYHEEKANV